MHLQMRPDALPRAPRVTGQSSPMTMKFYQRAHNITRNMLRFRLARISNSRFSFVWSHVEVILTALESSWKGLQIPVSSVDRFGRKCGWSEIDEPFGHVIPIFLSIISLFTLKFDGLNDYRIEEDKETKNMGLISCDLVAGWPRKWPEKIRQCTLEERESGGRRESGGWKWKLPIREVSINIYFPK